jgi:nucleotide-binding universal stress UspA family protein
MQEPAAWLLESHTELGQNLRREKEALEKFGVAVDVVVRPGEVLPEMLREIRRGDYGLVVAGSALSHGLQTYMLGDLSREIVNRAECAVLIIREPHPAGEAHVGWRGFFGRIVGE